MASWNVTEVSLVIWYLYGEGLDCSFWGVGDLTGPQTTVCLLVLGMVGVQKSHLSTYDFTEEMW